MLRSIHWNAVFALFLTRALLPRLRLTAKHGPVLVEFIGSVASDLGVPRLTLYGATKSFLRSLARGLDNDENVWDEPSGVHFAYLQVSFVQSGAVRMPASVTIPTSERFAKAVVATAGCGKRSYVPYWGHAAQLWFVGVLDAWGGEGIIDKGNAAGIKRNNRNMMKQLVSNLPTPFLTGLVC